jgi:hypothetical protein
MKADRANSNSKRGKGQPHYFVLPGLRMGEMMMRDKTIGDNIAIQLSQQLKTAWNLSRIFFILYLSHLKGLGHNVEYRKYGQKRIILDINKKNSVDVEFSKCSSA